MSVDAVLAQIGARFEDAESRAYLRTHGRRYRILLGLVGQVVTPGARILDVGPGYQTEAIRKLWPAATVDTIGFLDPRLEPARDGERHYEYDLAQAVDEATWPRAEPYDVIVFAEVIEHLHVGPGRVLALLASLLRPGGTLLVQTPNAAALSRRFWLLAGRNPFEPIRDDLHQAGHFREYTARELERLVRDAGLQPVRTRLDNYFRTGSVKNRLLVELSGAFPPGLRQGITLVARR